MTDTLNPEQLENKAQQLIDTLKAFWHWFSNDPVHAIGTLAILLLVAVIYSVRKRLGNNLVDFADKLVSLCTLFAISGFSAYDFGLRYRKHVIFEHRVFNVRGLRTQGTFTLEVDKVYVNLKIAPANHPNRSIPLIDNEKLSGDRPIWDFLRQTKQNWAIVGAPGCGKSTLLQHIAITFAANKHRAYRMPARFPVLLFLREHIDAITGSEINLAELAQSHFANAKRYPGLKPPDAWFERQLIQGRAVVLLDGLDEVADSAKRQAVSQWVDRQIVNYPRCRFIVTSRPQGYLAAPLQRAHRLEIQPFSWAQVKEFAHVWYLSNEILSFGKKDQGVLNKAKRDAEDLLSRLQQVPSLSELTVNPLLLTMIAMVHRYRGQLPGRRIELYAEICDVLLGHWRAATGLKENLTAAQKRVALQPLAAAMMEGKTREISTSVALRLIDAPLKQVGLEPQQAGLQFLKSIEAGSGLLCEKENASWSFAHLSFQEYLAACHWTENQTHINWADFVNDSWWHETLRLYAAQNDATGMVSACLETNNVGCLALAAECLEEALKLDDAMRKLVSERIDSNLDSPDPDLRRMAVEVHLARRLKNLQRIDDNTAIDLDWISCAEYLLFIEETENKHRPEHWLDYGFPPGAEKQPCMGIRAHSARAFCLWLSARTGQTYRLPSVEEVRSHPPQQGGNFGAWVFVPGQGHLALEWTNGNARQNVEQRLSAFSDLPVRWSWDLRGKENFDFHYHAFINSYLINLFDFEHIIRDWSRARYFVFAFFERQQASALDRTIFSPFAARHFYRKEKPALRNFDRVFLDRDRDIALELAHALGCVLHDRDLRFELAHALDLDLYLYLDHHVYDLALSFALADARTLALDLIKITEKAIKAITDQFNFFPRPQSCEFETALREWLALSQMAPPDLTVIRHAARNLIRLDLAMLIQELPFISRALGRSQKTYRDFFRFRRRQKNAIDPNLIYDILLAWYWALTIANARAEGKLDAWEGLRIVRERKDD